MPVQQLPCASATLRRASRAVSRLYDEAMQDAGIRGTQFTLLQALDTTGSITQGALGEMLSLDSTTLTRSLKLLEQEGWISSAPGDDRRERYFNLSAKGKKQYELAKEHWRQAQAKMRKRLGSSQWDEFLRLADRVTEAAVAARETL